MASDAGIYSLANRPTVELLDPFEIQRRRMAIQNALAAQQIQQQQVEQGSMALEAARRDQAAEEAFRAQFANPQAAAAPANALAAPPAGAGPVPGDPFPWLANGAPPAAAPAPAGPAPAAPPAMVNTPAGVSPVEVPDSALYATFGSKAPGIIKARNEAATAVATRNQKLGEVREQDQKYWGSLAGAWEHSGFDPRMIPGMLQVAAGHGLGQTPEFQQFAQLAQAGDVDGLKRIASLAITPEIRKSIAETGAAAALTTGRQTENAQNELKNAGALLGSTRDKQTYTAAYNGLKPETRQYFPAPENWTKATADEARSRGMSAAEQSTATLTAARDENTARHERVLEGIERTKAETARRQVEWDQGAIRRAGEALGRGELTRLKDIASLRGDQRLMIYDIAKQQNPNFNLSEVDRKIKNEDYYANGKGADALRSFNTFLEHGGAASDAVNQIRLSGVPAINKPLNWWRSHMAGDPALQQLIGSIEPVRKEFESYLIGGHALSVDDRKAADVILNENSSPAQIQSALKTMGHTAAARAREENYRYKKVSGHDLEDAFSPEAIDAAKKIGTDLGFGASSRPAAPAGAAPATAPAAAPAPVRLPPGSVSVTDPAGGIHYFPNAAAADEFRRLANIRQ